MHRQSSDRRWRRKVRVRHSRMQQEQRPPSKFLRWVKFLDRVQAWFKDEPVHKDYEKAAYEIAAAQLRWMNTGRGR